MKKANQLKRGIILSYIQMGISILIGIVYTPIMIRLLGQNEYGLYNTVSSTISMLSILNLGFNSGYIRYYAKYKKEENHQGVEKLNGLFLIIFSIIGIIAFLCGLYFTANLHLVFDSGLTDAEYSKAKILMFLLAINLAISFPMTVFSCIISAHEHFVFLKTLLMLKTILSPLITLPLLLMGFRSISMVLVSVTLALITDSIYIFYVIKIMKQRFLFCGFEKGILKDLFGYTFFIALNIIVDQINWNIDKILLARYKGTVAVAIYSVGYALYSYYQTFSTSISGVFTPRIHKIINHSKDYINLRKELTALFTRVGRVQFIVLALLMTGVIFFGKPFIIGFWAGSEYSDSYYVALLLMIPATVTLCQNTGIEIQRAQNKHRFRSVLYFFTALLNLAFSIYLSQNYGAIGAAFGTFASYFISSITIMNIYYHKCCNLDIVFFLKELLVLSKGLIVPVAFGIAYTLILNLNNIFVFFIGIILYTIVYVISMWFLGINEYEKNLVSGIIKKIINKH